MNRIEEVAKIMEIYIDGECSTDISCKECWDGLAKKVDALYSARFKEELEKARKCDVCGSNDLVCGKAWKEERNKLKAKLKAVDARFEKAVGKFCKCGNCFICVYQAEIRKRWNNENIS